MFENQCSLRLRGVQLIPDSFHSRIAPLDSFASSLSNISVAPPWFTSIRRRDTHEREEYERCSRFSGDSPRFKNDDNKDLKKRYTELALIEFEEEED
ncbi:unnamed protein product [Vicia faba]|uniref:Uncharacterized protein n=1 Tax=Vicia faba TaxID=3906 RepID=A0AAV1AVC2_VICFA|nr:unnamed protein product [Vicia faba]